MSRLTMHAVESEKALEALLARRVREAGGLCLKFSSQTEAGYPDRLCLFPGGRAVWVELKSKGRKPRPLQARRMEALRALGFAAFACDTPEAVEAAASGKEGER